MPAEKEKPLEQILHSVVIVVFIKFNLRVFESIFS